MASVKSTRQLLSHFPRPSPCRPHIPSKCSRRTFSSTRVVAASGPDDTNTPAFPSNSANSLNSATEPPPRRRSIQTRSLSGEMPSISSILDSPSDGSFLTPQWASNFQSAEEIRPHRLYIYAHKHNTHITLAQAPQAASQTPSSTISSTSSSASEQKKMVNTLISLSTGNLGFKKSQRATYDAAYQLAGFVFRQIQEKGILRNMHKLEVSLRGFGAGREAVTKAILGSEGRNIRGKIVAVMDATRLKHGGGTRAKRPRRL